MEGHSRWDRRSRDGRTARNQPAFHVRALGAATGAPRWNRGRRRYATRIAAPTWVAISDNARSGYSRWAIDRWWMGGRELPSAATAITTAEASSACRR